MVFKRKQHRALVPGTDQGARLVKENSFQGLFAAVPMVYCMVNRPQICKLPAALHICRLKGKTCSSHLCSDGDGVEIHYILKSFCSHSCSGGNGGNNQLILK
jgi:hypothetical protein